MTPLIIFVGLYLNYNKIKNNQNPEFVRRYSSLISELDQTRGFKCLLYYPLFTLRRLAYAFAQIYLNNFPILQKSIHLFFTILTFLYLIIVKPFISKTVLVSNIVTEGFMMLIFALILIIYIKNDIVSEDNLNFMFISCLIGCLGFQYFVSVFILLKQVFEVFKKFKRKSVT